MVIETTMLYILISVWMTLTFIQGHSCMSSHNLQWVFSQKFYFWFGWNSVCCHNLLVCWSSCWFYFCTILYSREKTLLTWFCKIYIFNIVLRLDTCGLICFRLGMVLNMTKFYSLIPVWMTLMFTQGYRVTGKQELVLSFCCKVAWSNSYIGDCWLCKGNDWRSPVIMVNMYCLSIYSSCLHIHNEEDIILVCSQLCSSGQLVLFCFVSLCLFFFYCFCCCWCRFCCCWRCFRGMTCMLARDPWNLALMAFLHNLSVLGPVLDTEDTVVV